MMLMALILVEGVASDIALEVNWSVSCTFQDTLKYDSAAWPKAAHKPAVILSGAPRGLRWRCREKWRQIVRGVWGGAQSKDL